MKKTLLLLLSSFLFAQDLELSSPHFSQPQEEIIAQFSQLSDRSGVKVALMMPKKIIGRYSVATIDTILAYLSARGKDFEFEVFDCGDEENDSIRKTYEQIEQKGFQFIVAVMTTKGAIESSKLALKIPLYIPTVNHTQIDFSPSTSPLLFFGGISYEEQIQKLLSIRSGTHIVAYNDDSPVGERLSAILKDDIPDLSELTVTNEIAATFAKNDKSQEALIDQADVFLNTPVVKTGLLLSQIGYFKKKSATFLSTQINYNPSLTILTQQRDRKNLYIANSIGKTDQKLIEYGSLLNSDLKYDWVNYSTAIGMEMFYKIIYPDSLSYFKERVVDNQIQYNIQIYQVDSKGFHPVKEQTLQELQEKNTLENP